MALGYATTLRNAQLDAITSAVGNAGKLIIYDGTRPATGGTATTALATFTLGTPFSSAASGAVLSPTLPSSVSATASGTATWYRITTAGGTFVMDGSVGTAGADMILNTTTITTGVNVQITSFTIQAGNA